MLGSSRPEAATAQERRGLLSPLRDESPLPRRDVRYRDQLGRGVWRCGAACRIPAASRLASWQWRAALPRWPSAARGVRSLAPAARSGKERDGSRSSLPASRQVCQGLLCHAPRHDPDAAARPASGATARARAGATNPAGALPADRRHQARRPRDARSCRRGGGVPGGPPLGPGGDFCRRRCKRAAYATQNGPMMMILAQARAGSTRTSAPAPLARATARS